MPLYISDGSQLVELKKITVSSGAALEEFKKLFVSNGTTLDEIWSGEITWGTSPIALAALPTAWNNDKGVVYAGGRVANGAIVVANFACHYTDADKIQTTLTGVSDTAGSTWGAQFENRFVAVSCYTGKNVLQFDNSLVRTVLPARQGGVFLNGVCRYLNGFASFAGRVDGGTASWISEYWDANNIRTSLPNTTYGGEALMKCAQIPSGAFVFVTSRADFYDLQKIKTNLGSGTTPDSNATITEWQGGVLCLGTTAGGCSFIDENFIKTAFTSLSNARWKPIPVDYADGLVALGGMASGLGTNKTSVVSDYFDANGIRLPMPDLPVIPETKRGGMASNNGVMFVTGNQKAVYFYEAT